MRFALDRNTIVVSISVQDDVRRGLADFGLGYVADMPEPFTTESPDAEAFYVVLPSRHRLSRAKEIELKALKDATLVSSRRTPILAGSSMEPQRQPDLPSVIPSSLTSLRRSTVLSATALV